MVDQQISFDMPWTPAQLRVCKMFVGVWDRNIWDDQQKTVEHCSALRCRGTLPLRFSRLRGDTGLQNWRLHGESLFQNRRLQKSALPEPSRSLFSRHLRSSRPKQRFGHGRFIGFGQYHTFARWFDRP